MKKKLFPKPHLDRKKKDPFRYMYTGGTTYSQLDAQLFKYDAENFSEKTKLELSDFSLPGNSPMTHWWNIHGLSDMGALEKIFKKFKIHSLAIQDILDVHQRPKFQEYDEYSFLTIKSILILDDDIVAEQISFIFTKNYLISFQEKKEDYFEHLRTRIREKKGIVRERGADFLLYLLLESILDNYFIALKSIEKKIDSINTSIFSGNTSPSILEEIEKYKNFVRKIEKAILPLKEFSLDVERGNVEQVETRHIKYFQEIQDLCLTLLDHSEIIETNLESKSNLFFSVQGHRLNQVMITLTIVATIFIPLTFIAGVYGMNFENMPELTWKYGYLFTWIVFVLTGFFMLYYFKRKHWF